MVTVPNLVGLKFARACRVITNSGLVRSATYSSSTTVPYGRIISQDLTVGSSVSDGSTITITMSIASVTMIPISNITDFQKISNDVGYPRTSNYILTQNIDASATSGWNSNAGWVPICRGSSTRFTGIFEGLGYEVQGLFINRASNNQSLFAYNGGTIRNLGITGNITGTGYVGGITGNNYGGLVDNCHSSVTLVGTTSYIGGIVGRNYQNYSYIRNCYCTSSITSGSGSCGGISGSNENTSSEIYGCYYSGTISASGNYVGGICGYPQSGTIISNCYSLGSITGSTYVGGIGGYVSYSTVIYSFSKASVTASGNNYAGGIAGRAGYTASITYCYATGAVTSSSNSGGLVGGISSTPTIAYSYWDKQTTGLTTSAGSDAAYGKTTAEMKTELTYSGWDFDYIWYISADYPVLRLFADYDVGAVLKYYNGSIWVQVNDFQSYSGGSYSSKPLNIYKSSSWKHVITE